MRIIFVPQYPTPMRYQEWWWWKLYEEFKNAGFEVITLGQGWPDSNDEIDKYDYDTGMFSPIRRSIEFETIQINEYMNLELKDDDILFLADLSFPGFFGNVLFHKKPKKCFAFCHATSLNTLDYFSKYRACKFPVEEGHAYMMDRVFVGSKYHQDKLGWPNTTVTRLPYPPFQGIKVDASEKYYDIISASRPNPQKVDLELENKVGEIFSQVNRPISHSWEDYFKNLSHSKVLLITSFEDTFGYQIVDAVMNGCIPLAPKRCAYPELLPSEYLYDSEEQLFRKLEYLLNSGHDEDNPFSSVGRIDPPTLLCDQEMKDFFENIIKVMKGEDKEYAF
jgi:hypothetical protein